MEDMEKQLAMILVIVLRGLGRQLSPEAAAAAAYNLVNLSQEMEGAYQGIPRNVRFLRALHALMLEKGLLTQAQLANACGLQQSVVSRMFRQLEQNPKYFPQLRVRQKLARGLGVDPAILDPDRKG